MSLRERALAAATEQEKTERQKREDAIRSWFVEQGFCERREDVHLNARQQYCQQGSASGPRNLIEVDGLFFFADTDRSLLGGKLAIYFVSEPDKHGANGWPVMSLAGLGKELRRSE
jgi:hypothetical protein